MSVVPAQDVPGLGQIQAIDRSDELSRKSNYCQVFEKFTHKKFGDKFEKKSGYSNSSNIDDEQNKPFHKRRREKYFFKKTDT